MMHRSGNFPIKGFKRASEAWAKARQPLSNTNTTSLPRSGLDRTHSVFQQTCSRRAFHHSRHQHYHHQPQPRPRPQSQSRYSFNASYTQSQLRLHVGNARQRLHKTNARTKSTTISGSQVETQTIRTRIDNWLNQPRTVPVPRWISPSHYTTTYSECFGHSSFLLVAMAYYTDDFLQLRTMAIAGSTSMLVFAYFHPHGRVLWLPFKWNLSFIAINCYRIGRVYLDRWHAEQMSPELRRLHDEHFYVMDTAEFGRLVRLSTMQTFRKGDAIVKQGEANECVRLVLGGEINVLRDSQLTYQLHEGNFISEVGLHAGLLLRGSVESCCSVVANSDDVRVLCWDRTQLIQFLESDRSVQRSIKAVMSWDIVSKLKSQRLLLSDGLIHDPEAWTEKRQEQTQSRYAAILHNMLLSDSRQLRERKEELHKYREIHNIDDASHERALRKFGWTLAEFEQGHRNGTAGEHGADGDRGEDSSSEQIMNGVEDFCRLLYYKIFK